MPALDTKTGALLVAVRKGERKGFDFIPPKSAVIQAGDVLVSSPRRRWSGARKARPDVRSSLSKRGEVYPTLFQEARGIILSSLS